MTASMELLSRSAFFGCPSVELRVCAHAPRSTRGMTRLGVRAEGFNLGSLMGGRGLEGGEAKLQRQKAEEKKEIAPKIVIPEKKITHELLDLPILDFNKEMSGLTGGFPGGEKGLMSFLEKFPPPEKLSKAVREAREALSAITISTAPAMVPPPLLMPGMTVKVTNPRDSYYQYSGIVQRITDGRVGVLFEGGNWDKMVAFDQKDLERTTKGPPGSNPKSAVLELMFPAKPSAS